MTTYKRGEVVLLPFPYTDLSTSKKRPAVILSSNKFNTSRQDCIVAPISGHLTNRLSEDNTLKYWLDAGLLKPSIVKSILGTIHQNKIILRLGKLTDSDLKNTEIAIANVLGIQS